MTEIDFSGLLIVVAVAFASPLVLMELGLLDDATGAALIAAGLLSVLAFPLTALTLLRSAGEGNRPSGRNGKAA